MPSKKVNKVNTSMMLEPALLDALKAAAAKRDVSVGHIIRQALKLWLEREGK